MNPYEINVSKYVALIGHVQSGKTIEEINYTYNSVNHFKIPVIFIVRNITADQLQLKDRFNLCEKKLNVKILSHLNVPESVLCLESIGVLIVLCNQYQLIKLKDILSDYRGEYNVCIDEVDFSIKSKNYTSEIDYHLSHIKEGASHILGATATPFALFSNKSGLSKIKKISPGINYCGIDTLNIEYIKPFITKDPRSDHDTIEHIYTNLLEKESCVLLHSVKKTKDYHNKLVNYVSSLYPSFTFIIYNGDGIRVKCTSRSNEPFAKGLSVNNYGQLINKYFQLNDNVHLFVNYSISEVLQILKNDKHNHSHISIISGHLASRGISFVSSDYSLHLTDQYFHPGKKSHGENLLQSLRILGCYKNDRNITLWCNKQTWKDIIEQNKIIDTLVDSCDDKKEWFKYIQEVIINKPSRPTTRSILSFKYDHIKDTNFKLNLEEEI